MPPLTCRSEASRSSDTPAPWYTPYRPLRKPRPAGSASNGCGRAPARPAGNAQPGGSGGKGGGTSRRQRRAEAPAGVHEGDPGAVARAHEGAEGGAGDAASEAVGGDGAHLVRAVAVRLDHGNAAEA